ncbi:MAG: hypothetical protein JXN60_03900, partial [Lentisphaerae bacterium]|nr:hypothetical protein [Lentisphaerota bacterium]
EDMLLAAENLENSVAEEAVKHGNSALEKLRVIEDMLGATQAAAEEEKMEEIQEVLEEVNGKIAKIKELHAKAQEQMDIIKANKNLDSKELDMMEEEYMALIKKSKDALLKVPTDLHIYMELNCANDIVEDLISIFQEVEQKAGSEEALQNNQIKEEEYAKKESLDFLKDLEQAEERIDDLEMWLTAQPDTTKVNVEAMDQEEMPEEGVALGALETKTEDLISDLLEESEDPEDQAKANDGAINRAKSDCEMGNALQEGDTAIFAAKGKSDNKKPDHKEQDGRSNVGRQGMSNGETAAGSGTIQEGDKNIEQRRTQDPTQSGQVDVEGEADTMASGGGKQGTGRADGFGDGTGGAKRMDTTMSGGEDGMKALMTQVERMYDQASIKNVRAPSLKQAAHHIRQAADAIAESRPIGEIAELKRKAAASLKKAQTELRAGTSSALDSGSGLSMLDGVVEGGADEAPQQYRDLVSKYYKALNEAI